MENSPPTRRLKLHRSTWVVGGMVLLTMLVIVLPGLQVAYSTAFNTTLGSEAVVYEHGWPYPFVTRTSAESASPLFGVPWLSLDAWKVWEAKRDHSFSVRGLVLDFIILGTVVAAFTAAWEWRLRRSRLMQVSLAGLLAVTTLVALPMGWYTYHRTEVKREQTHIVALENQLGDAFGSVRVPDYAMPQWLERLVGWDVLPQIKFNYVKTVMLRPQAANSSAKLEVLLPHLRALEKTDTLMLEVPSNDADLCFRSIAQLPQLIEVKLSGKGYAMAFDLQLAEQVVQMQQIARLEVSFEQGVTEEAKQLLRERMPNCTIEFIGDD